MIILDFLNQQMQASISHLQASSNNPKEVKTLTLDAKFFDARYFDQDIRLLELQPIFEDWQKINQPVLYWFEFDSSLITASQIRELYKNHLEHNQRNISSFKKNYDEHSNILYVGKVKTGFWGRVITHLGYHKSEKTAGLQLFHWYNVTKGHTPLQLNYIVFEKEMENLIAVLENDLQKQIKPILGRY